MSWPANTRAERRVSRGRTNRRRRAQLSPQRRSSGPDGPAMVRNPAVTTAQMTSAMSEVDLCLEGGNGVVHRHRTFADLEEHRSSARGSRRPGLHIRHRPSRTDIAAINHRQERPRRPAVQSRTPQPGPGIDDRQSRVGLGRSHRPRRNQGRHPARLNEAVDVTPSRSRA